MSEAARRPRDHADRLGHKSSSKHDRATIIVIQPEDLGLTQVWFTKHPQRATDKYKAPTVEQEGIS
jgi:hypothetical protein